MDSLKAVVEMRNSELHLLRSQVTGMEQLETDLEALRERNRTLTAKTEDLNAQMEAKAKTERWESICYLVEAKLLTGNVLF